MTDYTAKLYRAGKGRNLKLRLPSKIVEGLRLQHGQRVRIRVMRRRLILSFKP